MLIGRRVLLNAFTTAIPPMRFNWLANHPRCVTSKLPLCRRVYLSLGATRTTRDGRSVFGVTTSRSLLVASRSGHTLHISFFRSIAPPLDRTPVRAIGTRSALGPRGSRDRENARSAIDHPAGSGAMSAGTTVRSIWIFASDLAAILPQQDERRRRRYSQPRRWSERHYEPRERPGAPSRHRPGCARPIDACTFLFVCVHSVGSCGHGRNIAA